MTTFNRNQIKSASNLTNAQIKALFAGRRGGLTATQIATGGIHHITRLECLLAVASDDAVETVIATFVAELTGSSDADIIKALAFAKSVPAYRRLAALSLVLSSMMLDDNRNHAAWDVIVPRVATLIA